MQTDPPPPSSLYTRTGDNGSTGLWGGRRLPKDAPRIQTLGDLDQLNSQLGVVAAHCDQPDLGHLIRNLQAQLLDLGAELARPEQPRIGPEQVGQVETLIDRLDADLPPLHAFILPGGSLAAAHGHLARASCRQLERSLVQLAHAEPVNDSSLRWINRLSDLLFVVARTFNHRAGGRDVTWPLPTETAL